MADTKTITNDNLDALKEFGFEATGVDLGLQLPAELKIDEQIAAQGGEQTEAVELTQDEIDSIRDEAVLLKATKEDIEARLAKLTERARALDYGQNAAGKGGDGGKILIGRNPQFNEAKFLVEKPYDYSETRKVVGQTTAGNDVVREEVVYPNRDLYKITPDRPAIKRILGEDAASAFYDEGNRKVTFK